MELMKFFWLFLLTAITWCMSLQPECQIRSWLDRHPIEATVHSVQCPGWNRISTLPGAASQVSSLKIVLKSDATFDLKGVISSFKSVSFQSGISFQSGLLNVYFSKGPIFGRGGAYWTQTFLLKLGGAIASSKLSKMQVYSEKEQWLEPRSPLAPIANCYSPSLHLPLLSPNERINIL